MLNPSAAPAIPATTETTLPTGPITHGTGGGDDDVNATKVAELSTMFPTIDKGVIEMVLESVGGSSDRAIESLLGMTDPDFKPDELVAARRDESQVDLDAEFARSLQLQDQEDLERQLRRRQQSGARSGSQQQQQQQPGVLPYQPRIRKARPGQSGQYGNADGTPVKFGSGGGTGYAGNMGNASNGWAGGRERAQQYTDGQGNSWAAGNPPGMLNLEEKLGNFAEVGKQTFSSFFNRAKAKMAEIQANAAEPKQQPQMSSWGRSGSNDGYGGGTSNNWMMGVGGGGGEDKYTRSPIPGATGQTWRAMPGGNKGGDQGRGLWTDPRDTRSISSRSESFSSQSTADQQSAARAATPRWQPSDAFDDPLPPSRAVPSNIGNNVNQLGGVATGRKSPNTTVGSPDKNAAGKIDLAKLGLLPKKRVDLLSTSPPTHNPNSAEDEEDDDDDPNPGLPTGSTSGSGGAGVPSAKSLFEQIPKTPPVEGGPHHTIGDDEDEDELEYTRNPFDEK